MQSLDVVGWCSRALYKSPGRAVLGTDNKRRSVERTKKITKVVAKFITIVVSSGEASVSGRQVSMVFDRLGVGGGFEIQRVAPNGQTVTTLETRNEHLVSP